MTTIDDIIMNNPEILLYIDEIAQQREKIKSDWLNTFWQRLKYRLHEVTNNKILVTERDDRSSRVVIFGKSDNFIYKELTIRFNFGIEWWINAPNLLRIIIGLHDYDNRNDIWNHFNRFPELNEKIKRYFPDYHENPSSWIPSELPLIYNFANDEYLAENLNIWDSNEGDKLIDSLCNKIKVFVDVINEGIKEMSEVQK